MSTDKQTDSGGSLGSFKFNTVGREETATEVLVQQVDPATKMRNMIIGIVAVIVLGGIVWAGFKESGTAIFKDHGEGKQFQAPEHDAGSIR